MSAEEILKVGVLQMDLVWENPEANRKKIDDHLENFEGSLDLLILPEMFTTGFTMNPEPVAEKMDGETIGWMRQKSTQKNTAIAGSIIIKENENFYNRLLFVTPSGEITTYDKRHLFTLAGEREKFSCGKDRVIVELNGFRICLQICYDLRFPAFSRSNDDYDVLIYPANWPGKRVSAWEILLKARAIENVSYVIGVNRIGSDEENIDYKGQSQIVDYTGEILTSAHEKEGIFTSELYMENLKKFRQNFPFLNDRDQITVR